MSAQLGRVMFEVIGPIALMTAAGYLLRRALVLDIRSISRVVFYILAPCLVYTSILNLDFDPATTSRSLIFAAIYMAAMTLLALGLSRRYNGPLSSAFVLVIILLNNGNYGLPLNLFAFGEEGFGYALILYMFNSLVGSTISIYLAARGQHGGRLALRRTLATPIIWAMLAAFVSRQLDWRPNGSFFEMLTMAGKAAIPIFLIVLGMALTETQVRLGRNPITRATLVRMLAGPAIAIALARLVGLQGVAFAVAVLQGAMPTAVNSIVISNEFETAPDFVAGAVLLTTLVSLITLPGLLIWLL
ncbi:MAG: AEC family transporter [Caldilineales bacterium]|nr:AEC family transporter [Caldilineales bacterium]